MKVRTQIAFAVVSLAAAILPAEASEVAHLTNGFTIVCDHHTSVDGHVRLYTGVDSYIELNPAEIASIEPAPAEPKVQPAHAATDAKLTRADLHQILSTAGESHNVDVDLLASVVQAESNGNTHAVSHAGARGLMQLMPGTAAQLGVKDRDVPDQNVNGGTAYLDSLLVRYHDNLALALAAYNAGPAAVDRYHGIPPYRETRRYVARVIHEFNRRVKAHRALEARSSR